MKKTLILAIGLVLVIVGAGIAYTQLKDRIPTQPDAAQASSSDTANAENNTARADGTAAGTDSTAAPDFVFYDAQEQPHRLSDYRGKRIVLNFWASWCSPCKREMPEFQAVYEEYGDDVQFLMVNLTGNNSDTVRSANFVIEDGGYTFPVFYDLDAAGATAYAITSVPTTVILDADGTILQKHIGTMDADTLRSMLGN